MQYWHDMLTEESWELLKKIKGKFGFILIGGWAVYLWAKKNKSRDVDIIVDFKTVEFLNKNYDLRKNDKMKKYEIKEGNIDIGIYVPYYSDLGLPLEKIGTSKIEGFLVAKIEELLILKQFAELARSQSPKGEKDRVDIMSLLINCDVDFSRYKKLLEEFKLHNLRNELLSVVRNFKEYKYLNLTPRELKLKKKKLLALILKN